MKIHLKLPHPQAIQDIDEFVSLSEQICEKKKKLVKKWSILARSDSVNLKCLNDAFLTISFLLLKTLNDGLEPCGLLWCFYQLFSISHSDGTHSLQSIHW